MSASDIIKDNIAPLVQRILSDPLHFKPAKHQEVKSNRPSSYIKIGTASSTDILQEPRTSASSKPQQADSQMEKPRPTSLAQALAGYTSKRSINDSLDNGTKSKKFKKQKLVKEPELLPQSHIHAQDTGDSDDLGQSLVEEEPESAVEEQTEYKSESESQSFSSEESDDANYTDASGFVSETPRNIISAKVFKQFNSGSNSSDETSAKDDKEEDSPDDEDEEEDDADYVENGIKSESESEGTSTEEEKLQKENNDEDEEEDEDESLELLKRDLLADRDPLSPDINPTTSSDEQDSLPSKPTINRLEHFYEFNELGADRGSNKSNRILKNWGNVLSKSKPLGLLNQGVTCYTNAAVQAMVHIPAVQHYLDDVLANKYKDTINPRSVTHVLAETSSRMWDKGKKVKYINPKKLIGRLDDINCMMSEWQQEDSHEYFMSLLSRLQEDSTPKGRKLNESIIYDIFGGLLKQSVTCKRCGHVSTTQQEFYDLSLHLGAARKNSQPNGEDSQPNGNGNLSTEDEFPKGQKYSIIKSIKDFFSPELIKTDKSDKSGYVCEKCKNRTNAIKISTIDRAPETLAVHLKRFRFNGNSSSKVKQGVTYPLILDLSQYTTENEPVLYQLVSVVVHEGRSVSSGHYVAHCRQPDGTWATYDDEYINSITEKQALRDPSAYYLIYSRLTHKDHNLPNVAKSNETFKEAQSTSEPPSESSSESSPEPSPEPSPEQTSLTKSNGSSKTIEASKPETKKLFEKLNPIKKFNILKPKSPNKPKIGGLQPTNNLGNIGKKSLKKYSKNPKDLSSKRFRKY